MCERINTISSSKSAFSAVSKAGRLRGQPLAWQAVISISVSKKLSMVGKDFLALLVIFVIKFASFWVIFQLIILFSLCWVIA